MPNPTPDFPNTLHDAEDTSAFANIPTGDTNPTLTELAGKTEEELYELGRKIGIGESTPIADAFLVGTDTGESAWLSLEDIQTLLGLGATQGQLFLSAAGMWPSTTNGAALNTKVESSTNKQNVYVLDFADGATSLSAEATVAMPSDWDGGTITAAFYWMVNSASTNSAVWQIKGRSYGDGETLDQSWGSAQSVADAGSGTANQVLKSAATSAITLAGTPAAGELVQFNVFRDPTNGSDNLAATARLLGVMINYTRA